MPNMLKEHHRDRISFEKRLYNLWKEPLDILEMFLVISYEATMYNNLGGAWKTLGDSKKAIEYCEKSYKIFLDIYGDQHPHTRTVKEALDALES
jgi:tetratricopeptide (TPR) repeat protein